MPTTNYGSVVTDTSLIPYMRSNEVEFTAYNLKPYKLSTLFFDDIAVNIFCQNASRVIIDSKKSIVLSRNNATTIVAADKVYQGTSNAAGVNTFSGIIQTFTSSSNTIIVKSLTGAFDKSSQLFIEAATAHDSLTVGVTFANCNVVSFVNTDNSDSFYPGEGVIIPQKNNCFATIISTTGENVLYVNRNYISLNVTGTNSTAVTAMTQDFKVGDIVYQTSDGSKRYDRSVFKGIVRYYNTQGETSGTVDTTIGSIAIDPVYGRLTVNATSTATNANVRLWNASNTASLALGAKGFNISDFASSTNVKSVTNTTIDIAVTSQEHKSGVIANTFAPNTSAVILNSTNGYAAANANLIYFVSGTGVGDIKRIIAITNQTVVLNTALSFTPDCTTHYSIGNFISDEFGSLAGVFHIPSYPNVKFKTGERIFTITDTNTVKDPDYTMRAAATYTAGGLLKTTQRIQTSPVLAPMPEVDSDALVRPQAPADRTYNSAVNKPPVTGQSGSNTPRIPLGDGLSQTFFVPKPIGNQPNYGIFCTSIDLFFKRKPVPGAFFNKSAFQTSSSLQLPITVKIAEVQNGYPTKNYLAAKTIQAKDVNISDLPSTSNTSTRTRFTFDDPVYLEPSREYAITIASDSPDYELFISELGADVLGATTPRRISEQPYAGLLFRSQNSSTWSPYQNQDLMFVLNKAVFTSSGSATFRLDDPPRANIDVDRVMLMSSDLTFPAANVNYRLKGIYGSTTNYESGSGIAVVPFKPVEYGVLSDKAGKTQTTLNRRRLLRGNINSYILTTEMSTTSTDVSPIVNLERMAVHATTFFINNGGLSNTLISISNPGTGYNAHISTGNNAIKGASSAALNNFAQLYRQTYLSNNYNVGFYSINISGGGPNAANAQGFAVANTDGANTINYIVLASGGLKYIETPTISINVTGNATSTTQAYASINGETDKSGGNMVARYICRQVVLEDGFESGDLRVFMDAIRPSITDIQVYYKVVSADDAEFISAKRWRRMEKVKELYSKNNRTLIGLEFRPSLTENRISYTENGVNYPIGGTFKTFQIKVCLMSSDPSVVPKVKNLRITAIPEG